MTENTAAYTTGNPAAGSFTGQSALPPDVRHTANSTAIATAVSTPVAFIC